MANYYSEDENINWHNNLPAKHCAASVVCWNQYGQILFVMSDKDNYWALPGGVVEKNESPVDGAIREAREELGIELDHQQLRFIGVDYSAAFKGYDDFLHFYFNVGVLEGEALAQLGQRAEKAHGIKFLSFEDLGMHVPPYRLKAFQEMFKQGDSQGMFFELDFGKNTYREIE